MSPCLGWAGTKALSLTVQATESRSGRGWVVNNVKTVTIPEVHSQAEARNEAKAPAPTVPRCRS